MPITDTILIRGVFRGALIRGVLITGAFITGISFIGELTLPVIASNQWVIILCVHNVPFKQ